MNIVEITDRVQSLSQLMIFFQQNNYEQKIVPFSTASLCNNLKNKFKENKNRIASIKENT